ncbi:MAG: 2-phosphosulfolactate phosphatase [Marinoscillum sp.]
MNQVEVCLTPDLIGQYDLDGKIVVVVDIFRATSCIVTGLAYGVKSIYPVSTVDECFEMGKQGYITAGERGGKKIDGFKIGNSPFEYMQEEFKDQSIAVTTTNGTKAILASLSAKEILIGAFLNLHSLANYLATSNNDVVIHCAGWKGTVNTEDTLFAGALIDEMKSTHKLSGDSSHIAHNLYQYNRNDLMQVANASSHARRLATFGIERDIAFCMDQSLYSVIPVYREGLLEILN